MSVTSELSLMLQKKDDDEKVETKQHVPRMYLTFKGIATLLIPTASQPRQKLKCDTLLYVEETHSLKKYS